MNIRTVLAARATAAAVGMVALAWSHCARADDADTDLHGYYGGERLSAVVICGMGAAAAASGAFLVTREPDFARGLGWAWLVMGGLETVGAVAYAIQVGGEIDHYEAVRARDPAAYRAEEIDHIRGTSSRFVIYRTVELALTLAGAGISIYGLAENRATWLKAGLGIASLALPLLVLDTFNNARASRYLDGLQRGQPSVSAQPVDEGRGWVLSVAGRL
jgi:hypothetical protein